MPGITNPAEEYFKDGIWGWVADQWKKLVATAAGALHVYIAGQAADVEVTQTAAADLTTGGHGWDGSAWHKLPMVWGYSDRWTEKVVATASGAGHATTVTTAVPAGYVYVLQAFSLIHDAGADKQLRGWVTDGAATTILLEQAIATSGQWYPWGGEVVLSEGDALNAATYSPGDGKTLELHVRGYKMKIAE